MFRTVSPLAPLLVLAAVLAACAGGNSSSGFKFYGNFCGPSHPRLASTSRADKYRELATIQPVDELDATCKAHDMCYAQVALNSLYCDNVLMAELIPYDWSHPYCKVLASRMTAGILYGTTWSEIHVEEGLTAANTVAAMKAPVRQAGLAYLRAMAAPVTAGNLALAELQYATAGKPAFEEGECRPTRYSSPQLEQWHRQQRGDLDRQFAEMTRNAARAR